MVVALAPGSLGLLHVGLDVLKCLAAPLGSLSTMST